MARAANGCLHHRWAGGFRSTPENAGARPLFVVGGSAVFGFHPPSDRATFAWLLGERVSVYRVVNAAVVGYLSGQELAQIVHRLDDAAPAGYVVVDGWNDRFDQFLVWDRRSFQLLGMNNTFFLLQDRLYEIHRAQGGREARSGERRPLVTPAMPEEEYLSLVYRSYATNLERMHAFARGRGAFLLVAFQPELGAKRVPARGEVNILDEWNHLYRYLDRKFPERYAAMVKHAKERCEALGIPFIDLSTEPALQAEGELLYLDPVHLNERGQYLLADILARRIAALASRVP